jgi:hypothetical protein
VLGERPVCLCVSGFGGLFGFCLNLVEADCGLKHEENIKTLFADVFDDASYILRLRDGLVDRFAKFLDKVFDLLIQCHLRAALWFESSPRIGYSRHNGPAGNGIAGTSVVPSYFLNNTPMAAEAAMTFMLHIKLYKMMGLS